MGALPAAKRTGWPWDREVPAQAYSHLQRLPRISIITPSYQQAGFLEETLRSVLLQNYPNLEFLVADGGSTDGSVQVLENYAPWLTWWVSERDKGTADANNKCLARMTGQFWLVINSDDVLLEGALLSFVEYLNGLSSEEYARAHWITSGIHIINEHSTVKAEIMPKPAPEVGGYTFGNYCWIYHPCTFLSADVYKRFGGFSMLDLMDYAYWVQMEKTGYWPQVVDAYWAALRFHTDCKSADFVKSFQMSRTVTEKLMLEVASTRTPEQLGAFQRRLKEWDFQIWKGIWQSALYDRDHNTASAALGKLLVQFPEIVLKRWFWGSVRKGLTGSLTQQDFSPNAFLYE